MNFDIITQVRYSSSRLPGKVLLNYGKVNLLTFFVANLKKIKSINKIILACPNDKYIDIFRLVAKKLGVELFSYNGDQNNVLDRYYKCAKKYSSENIIRITSDCPFINIEIVKYMMNYYRKKKLFFLTNNKPRYVPHGFDCEIVHFSILKRANMKAKSNYEREHVTPWVYKHYFKKINNVKILKENYSGTRLTIDTPNDYLFFKKNEKILNKISTERNFIKYLKKLNYEN